MTYLTEDDAKTKWCPHTGIISQTGDRAALCIGSACMMFRWRDDAGQSEADGTIKYEGFDHGYCGLAGRPE